MQEQDTVKLLRECDAGIKMGISSIDEVMDYVKSGRLLELLSSSKAEHEKLKGRVQGLLDNYYDEGKQPNLIAKGMSWIKTNAKLAANESDKTAASLITDGCDMGVKSLNRYLNQYAAANEKSKNIVKELIALEEKLGKDLRDFL